MINYSNVSALVKGDNTKRAYGFFDSAKSSGGGLTPKEHDRRLRLREEAYEMRRQRGQERKVEYLRAASEMGYKDHRREASARLSEDIARMRAVHPVKLELDRATHAQELAHKGDFHTQSLGFERDRAAVRLDATKATDAYKLGYEVRKTRALHAVRSELAGDMHQQLLGQRLDTHRQETGLRDQAHRQRLQHFEDQVATGMRRRLGSPTTVKTKAVGSGQSTHRTTKQAPTTAPQTNNATPTPAPPVTMDHPSPKVRPRRNATPQPATPDTTTQPRSMGDAVDDIRSAMGGNLRRSSHDPRRSATPKTAPSQQAPASSAPASSATPAQARPQRAKPKPAAPATAPAGTPAAATGASPVRLPRAGGVKLPGSDSFEHVSGRFSWDKRSLEQRTNARLPGERIETREESSARIRSRRNRPT